MEVLSSNYSNQYKQAFSGRVLPGSRKVFERLHKANYEAFDLQHGLNPKNRMHSDWYTFEHFVKRYLHPNTTIKISDQVSSDAELFTVHMENGLLNGKSKNVSTSIPFMKDNYVTRDLDLLRKKEKQWLVDSLITTFKKSRLNLPKFKEFVAKILSDEHFSALIKNDRISLI